ncbi:MAG: MBL fold metallo-hydrolase [Deltaproteobacteria bacterium]|nr:MBL fold metallo-hydrolase [Deltaproteobacteria bacterium]
MFERVEKNITLVRGENGGRFPSSHSLLVTGERTALIDTGCGTGVLEKVKEKFSPDMVIYSHTHPDHCSGSACFEPEVLWGPGKSRATAGDLDRLSVRFIAPDLREEWIVYIADSTGFRNFSTGNYYDDGHHFHCGDTVVEAVYAPGHTDDHYCFYLPHEKIMLTTDIDFTSFGPWYGNPESDLDAFIRSIQRVGQYDINTVVSSHMGVIREGIPEAFDGFLEIIEQREKRILDFLDKPRSLEDFVKAALIYRAYKGRRAGILRYWEYLMVSKHLERLQSRGVVTMVENSMVVRK